MLKELALGTTVYLVTGYTDLRQGIDGLSAKIQGALNIDPSTTALFLFCGQRLDRIKGLVWDGDGKKNKFQRRIKKMTIKAKRTIFLALIICAFAIVLGQ